MSLVSSAGSMSGDSGPTPFLFPQTKSRGLPDPSNFFSPDLLSSPLPTHSFFHNFVVEKGKGAAYIHPYLISFSASTLYISYPRVSANSTRITGSSSDSLEIRTRWGNTTTHRVSSFSDISVTVDFPLDNVSFFLCRGSPFVTCDVAKDTQLYIFTHSEILRAFNSPCLIKHTIELSNGNTWLLYFSSPIDISHGYSTIRTSLFSGIIRIALLPDSNPLFEEILDRFYSCYPVSGTAEITKKFCIEYKWETEAEGDLLMLAHPLHLRLLSLSDCTVIVLENFKYNSIDGELVGVVGDSWVLKSNDDPLSVTWHSLKGINEESRPEICNALENDVEVVCSVKTSTRSIHSYGKLIAKAARFAMIAEEVPYKSVIPQITRFLKDKIEPWLDGTYNSNGFLYDRIWGGIVMREESEDYLDSRGFGLSHAHHFHVGYFLYAIAVLAKIDVEWGSKYRPQTYSLISDFMNLVRSGETDKSSSNNYYPRLRCFDLWKLHSWSGGLSYYAVERYLDSVGEALNAYYSATLIGLVYGDTNLVELGSMLSAMEIYSAKTWCHVREEQNTYAHEFSTYNRMVVKSWSSERLSPQKYSGSMKEYSLQEQVLPLLPITEVLLSDIGYVKELVEWILQDVFATGDPGEEGRGVVCALEAIYDKEIALHKVNKLKRFADGNSFTNILWWIHSRMPSPFSSSPSTSGNSMSLFTYEELSKATDEFSKANWLGEGGFGTVYKGFLADGKAVAIKQLKNCGEQGKLQFQAEVEIINRTHHPRLVSLVGYCISEHHRLLIYDYVPNGTLDDHLHDHFRPVMAWANRVRVAIGAARGITYLHEDCYPRIIHRDIKSSNILLDYNFDPKVADFGLAKSVPENKTHVSTIHLAGSYGYLAPEYALSYRLTEKIDVYSFGVVLLELITGHVPLLKSQSSTQQSLVEWARPFLMQQPPNDEDFEKLVDSKLENNFVKSEMLQMIKVATACVTHSDSERPQMIQVLEDLAALMSSNQT